MSEKQMLKPSFASTTSRSTYDTFRFVVLNWFRESLSLSTWLALGAGLQALLFMLPIRRTYAVAPIVLYLFSTVAVETLRTLNVLPNVYRDRQIMGKTAAVLPHPKGGFAGHSEPYEDKICVFILGMSINHTLGPLAPGYMKMGEAFAKMYDDLEKTPQANGFLGANFNMDQGNHHTKSSTVVIFYFKSMDHIHRWAHGPVHREGWDWYNKHTKQYPHIGVWHEGYEAPAGKWESVYINQGATGFGTTKHWYTDESGQERWTSPLIDASRGRLNTAKGRLSGRAASVVEAR